MSNLLDLKEKFDQTSDKNRIPLISQLITQGEDGYQILRDFLFNNKELVNPTTGKIYQVLKSNLSQENKKFLNRIINQPKNFQLIVSLKYI